MSEDKIRNPKTEIILAAQSLIANRGFVAVTLQDILDEAKITKGKFFHYFGSKDELYAEILKHAFSHRERLRYEELIKECSKTSAYERLIWLLDRTIEWHRGGLPEVLRLCVFATVFFAPDSEEIKEVRSVVYQNTSTIEALITAAQAEKDLPNELSANVLSRLFPSAGVGGNTVGYLSDFPNLSSSNIEMLKTMLILIHESHKQKQLSNQSGKKND